MLTYLESLPLVQTALLAEEDWLIHGFGTKDIRLEQYLKVLAVTKAIIPETKQTHSNQVHLVTTNPGARALVGDAFLTNQPGVVCWVRTADCVPILLADVKRRVVGAIHAGWRGTAQKIIGKALQILTENWGSHPQDLKVALGPAIGGHCYQVGSDVWMAWQQAGLPEGPGMEKVWHDRWFLDLAVVNLQMMEQWGIPRSQIYLSLACTACDLEKFHSYRRERGKEGRQVSFILIR